MKNFLAHISKKALYGSIFGLALALTVSTALASISNFSNPASETDNGDLFDVMSVDTMQKFIGINNATPTTDLDITGNAKISNQLDIGAGNFIVDGTGNVTSGGITSAGTIDANTLNIGGGFGNTGATIDNTGNMNLDGNLHVNGSVILDDGQIMSAVASSIQGDMLPSAPNTFNIGAIANRWLNAWFSGDINVNGATNTNTLATTGTATVGGTLTTTGLTTANGGLAVTGGTNTDTLATTGTATVGGTLTTTGLTTANGGLAVTGGTNTDTLATTGAATIGGTLGVTGTTTLTGATTANGGLLVTGGDATVGNNLNVTGTTTTTGLTTANGGLTVAGSATVNGTTTSNGGLIVNTFGGSSGLFVDGTTGLTTANSGLAVAGATNTGTLVTTGAATVGGNLAVTGTTTLTGAATANGGLTVSGTAGVIINSTNGLDVNKITMGYQVTQGADIAAAASMNTIGTEMCPSSTQHILGGGCQINTSSPGVYIIKNAPVISGTSSNQWRCIINNTTGTQVMFNIFTICANIN